MFCRLPKIQEHVPMLCTSAQYVLFVTRAAYMM